MSITIFLVASTACVRSDAPEHDPTPAFQTSESPEGPGDFRLIDANTLPTRWLPAPGWILNGAMVLGDITGDGIDDAAVSVNELGNVGQDSSALLISGPLRRSLTLPGDEIASFPRSWITRVGDATADGAPDLRVEATAEREVRLMEGPFRGAMDPLSSGTPLDGDFVDIDGDGILDKFQGVEQEIRVTWGPASRWSDPPDLVIQPSCQGEYAEDFGFLWVKHLDAHPDLDGDGRREIWFEDGTDHVCESWLFPVPTSGGTYVPDADPAAFYGIRDLTVIGDQTGDGIADVWTSFDRQVHAAPVTFAAGQIQSAQTIQADPDLYEIRPVPFDLDGDGLTEFLAMDAEVDESEILSQPGPIDRVSGEVMVIVPGGPSLSMPGYSTVWDIAAHDFQEDDVFLEDGTVSVLVHGPDEIIVVDLGPGSVP